MLTSREERASEQRIRDSEVLSLKWDVYMTVLPLKAQISLRRSCGKMVRGRGGWWEPLDSVLRTQQGNCTNELTAVVTLSSRPIQDQTTQTAAQEREELLRPIPSWSVTANWWCIAIKLLFTCNTNDSQIRVHTGETPGMDYLFSTLVLKLLSASVSQRTC